MKREVKKMNEFRGCPGSVIQDLKDDDGRVRQDAEGPLLSHLRQWPIQLHLVSPTAPYYQGSDVLLSADCVAFSLGSFHRDFLKGKSLAIACPKLDDGQDAYIEKIRSWIEDAQIKTLTVMIMQVPCCMGLSNLAQQAAQGAQRQIPIRRVVVGIQGEILREEWLSGGPVAQEAYSP
jgi:hypothetical protein